MIIEQRQQIAALRKKLITSTAAKALKIRESDLFEGKQDKLKTFLTQIELYLKFKNVQAESNKVLLAVIYLKGDAFNWFEPRVSDFLDKLHED